MLPEQSIRKRAGKVVDSGSVTLAHLQESIETNELLKELVDKEAPEKEIQKVEVVNSGQDFANLLFSALKGEKGDSRTDEELLAMIEPLIPEPIKGDSYVLTKKDKEEIAKSITVPVVEKITETVIKEQPIVKEVAIPETPEEIRNKLETLEGEERLDAKSIKGLPEFVENRTSGFGSVIRDITAGTNITIDKSNPQYPIVSSTASGGATTFTALTDVPSSYTGQGTKFVRVNGAETALEFATVAGGGDALTSAPLSQFAATTSLQLKGVMSDETGSGALVFSNSPTLVTPTLGVATVTSINGATITSGTLNGTVTGTNTGDQTSIVGITGTKAQFDTAVTDGNFMYIGDAPTAHTHLLAAGATDVTATAAELNVLDGITASTIELNYTDGVTSAIQTQLNGKQASMGVDDNYVTDAEKVVIGNTSGTNTGDQTNITGNAATVTTNANLTGHVTSVGNAAVLGSFTKAQLDTAVSDGNVLYVGDVTQYTDELAQDAVGAMVDTSLVYVDATPLLTRAALTGDVTASQGSNATTLKNNLKLGQITMMIGDGVSAISTNATSFVVPCTFAGTITGYTIAADAGTCTIKTWKKATGTAIPTVADVISTSGVSLSTGTLVRSSTVSDFTSTTVTANDVFIIQATAVATAKYISFTLEIQKS